MMISINHFPSIDIFIMVFYSRTLVYLFVIEIFDERKRFYGKIALFDTVMTVRI